MTPRRDFLALAAGAVAAGTVLPIGVAGAAEHHDADLIRICAEHVVNMDAYNRSGAQLPLDDDPLWLAYERTRDAIHGAKPKTIEGMLAKARAAKAEARGLDGSENPECTPAAYWAWDLVNDLLAGRAVS
jgi:hypothetical protein